MCDTRSALSGISHRNSLFLSHGMGAEVTLFLLSSPLWLSHCSLDLGMTRGVSSSLALSKACLAGQGPGH